LKSFETAGFEKILAKTARSGGLNGWRLAAERRFGGLLPQVGNKSPAATFVRILFLC
jgi:hypothetical protein